MTNLLHVSPNQFAGINIANHTCKIWLELAKGFDNYYILARSKTNKFEKFKHDNITLILIPKVVNKSSIFIITSFLIFFYIKKLKITHILCQSAIFGGAACVLAKKIFKLRLMIEIHGEEYFRILNSNNFIIKFFAKNLIYIYKSADKVRSLNKYMTAKLLKHNISENVVEIYNRVNLDVFNVVKNDFKIKDETVKIVSVGRFVKEKNYTNLIKYLSKSGLKYHLTLIGGGTLKEEYIDVIKKSNIENNVTLIDWINQEDFVKIVVNNDIYIQSSVSEGMPRTIVEAMAMQLPIISTRVGSIEGVLEDGINGLLVSTSENEIIDALTKMANSEDLRTKLAKQAYYDASVKYNWNDMFDLYRREIKSM